MLNIVIVVVSILLTLYLAFSRRLSHSSKWNATVTPLASIMGSGFLVCAPLLSSAVGYYALFCMAALLALSYAVGGAIRFNIRHFEPIENSGPGIPQKVALLSRIVLAGAYFISVTYYLQLLAAFLANIVGVSGELLVRLVTTALLVTIGGFGMWRGLGMLERLEKYAVALKLGMIGGLLLALLSYNSQLFLHGQWKLPNVTSEINLHDLRILLGLLIVVQGFETSRFLGDEHSAEERISTMRYAQLISAVIYIAFIALVTVLFHNDLGEDVTAIIEMTRPIAIVLPILITIAAIGSQFSAAVADNAGAGGLIEEITYNRLPSRYAYLLILIVTVALTWETNVYEIIAYASRAFALFYTLQCIVAFTVAWQTKDLPRKKTHLARFALLSLICLIVFVFGIPAE